MNRLLRSIAGALAGIVVAFAIIVLIELFGAAVYPTPEGFTGSMEEMNAYVAVMPHWVLVVGAIGWGLTGFASTWVANRVGTRGAAIFVGVLLVIAAIANIAQLPYYLWFKIVAVPLILAGIYFSLRGSGTKA